MDIRSIALALLVVVIWGLNFSVIKFGLDELPPLMFSGLRFLIVAVPAVLIVPFPKTSVWNVLGVGLFLGVIKFGLLFIAMQEDASAGIASLLLQSQVIFTILLSVLWLKESISRSQIFGIAIAVTGFSLFFITSNGNATLLGVTMIILAGLFWAVSNLIMKQMSSVNLLHFMVWVSVVPPLPLFALSYLFETQTPIALLLETTEKTWLSVAYVGYISTLLAFAIWGWLLKNHQAAAVTPFALLIPLVGMLGSSLLLDEQFSVTESVGASLILVGLLISVLGARLYGAIRQKKTAEQISQ
ncbi:EamA family transporter [Photobacterium sp. TY1-4]|uniref:EamA family transporter n=1 Tax=Photobacterium sp. TY1-4 TaxID=2899122 RepID=UPI0021C20B09|nr:EamA family transporter [Photobacterium sp. TY1-4]UXH99958.1 EamA family transporter [Photobacterium sp. TY1-4]